MEPKNIEYYHHSIRLLRLRTCVDPCADRLEVERWTGSESYHGAVEVDLLDSDLDKAKFDAQSCTWCPLSLAEQIQADRQLFPNVQRYYPFLCAGKIIRVTKSLRDALGRLSIYNHSQAAKQTGKLPLTWADDICINQHDWEKRSEQVALMEELYSKPTQVIAYIGEHDDYSRMGLNAAKGLTLPNQSNVQLRISKTLCSM